MDIQYTFGTVLLFALSIVRPSQRTRTALVFVSVCLCMRCAVCVYVCASVRAECLPVCIGVGACVRDCTCGSSRPNVVVRSHTHTATLERTRRGGTSSLAHARKQAAHSQTRLPTERVCTYYMCIHICVCTQTARVKTGTRRRRYTTSRHAHKLELSAMRSGAHARASSTEDVARFLSTSTYTPHVHIYTTQHSTRAYVYVYISLYSIRILTSYGNMYNVSGRGFMF